MHPVIETKETKMELLAMNDDCLEHVLRFLDLKSLCSVSDTCKHLSRIAEGIFKKQRHYECHIGDKVNVKKACEIIRKIGPYIVALDLDFDPIDIDLYVEAGIGCRFLQFLNHSLGAKFCELKLSGDISSFPIFKLAPTLARVQKLSICCDISDDDPYQKEYTTVSIDLPQLCPNLRQLFIEECALIFAPNRIKSFRHLESLEFLSYGGYYPLDSLASFFKQNKQLRKLYVDNLFSDDGLTYFDMEVLAKNLTVLEDLRIRTVLFDNWVQAMRVFSEHQNLTTLVMSDYFNDVDDMNNILAIVKTMKQLKKVAIGWCFLDEVPNQQTIIDIATELKQLESLQIDVKCDEHTITECIRNGRNLRKFCVGCRDDRVVTTTFIKNLAKVRESSVADSRNHPVLVIYFRGEDLNGNVLKVEIEKILNRRHCH